jgi:hypothetical protein
MRCWTLWTNHQKSEIGTRICSSPAVDVASCSRDGVFTSNKTNNQLRVFNDESKAALSFVSVSCEENYWLAPKGCPPGFLSFFVRKITSVF